MKHLSDTLRDLTGPDSPVSDGARKAIEDGLSLRTIIAGSRDLHSYRLVARVMEECGWVPSVVLSGGARGIDTVGAWWAKDNGIHVERWEARWDLHGRAAGIRRNVEMAKNADALVAVWDGSSRGTAHMIDEARRRGLRVYVMDVSKGLPLGWENVEVVEP